MKKLIYFAMVALMTVFAACGSKSAETTSNGEKGDATENSEPHKTKELTATTSDFEFGDVARCIEVDKSSPAKFTLIEDEQAGMPRQIWRLEVPIRLVKSDLDSVDFRDISFTGFVGGAKVEILNSDDVKTVDLDVKDLLELKKFLTKEEGTVETFIFESETYNHQQAPEWFETSVSFKPTMTSDITLSK